MSRTFPQNRMSAEEKEWVKEEIKKAVDAAKDEILAKMGAPASNSRQADASATPRSPRQASHY